MFFTLFNNQIFCMKKVYIAAATLLSILAFQEANSQLVINGATLVIEGGAVVSVQGNISSTTDIQGAGKILMNGTTAQQLNMNGNVIPNLEINNNTNVSLTGNARIGSSLLLTTGKVLAGSNNLILSPTASITGASATNFIALGGTGSLVKEQLSNTIFTYPVGASIASYTPVSIANSGTIDNIGVKVLPNVLNNGGTGVVVTKEVVDVMWEITETTPGGSNLAVTTNWNALNELPGFDRTKSGLSRYDGIGWDLTQAMAGTAGGTNPYNFTRSSLTPGFLAVGRRPVMTTLLVSPKIFLQGAYNIGTSVMNDNLRTLGLIPTNTPYDALSAFPVSGSGGGETINSSIFAVAGNDAIVDWVFAQLYDGSTGIVISSRSVLLQKDGDVVETDGITPVNFAGFSAGNYFVSLRHRNHLGVRTTATASLARTTTTPYDFTNDQAKAFAGLVSNPPMATLGTGVFGMYGGNANSDLFTRRTGSASSNDYSLLLTGVGNVPPGPTGVYSREDYNMDGNIRKTGSSTTNDYSRLLSILGSATTITQPTF